MAFGAAPGELSNRTVSVGSTYTIIGQTGARGVGASRATGQVTLSGRWDGGHPQLIARTTTSTDGRYRLTVHLLRRGALDLRLATPDRKVTHVVLAVI